MKQLLMQMTSGGMQPQALRRSIQESDSSEMASRRAIVGVSLVGIASMAIVSLYQMGAVRHLPDPPVRRPHFHSDKVNASTEAFGYGMPDGPLTIGAHAANIMLAAAGPDDRGAGSARGSRLGTVCCPACRPRSPPSTCSRRCRRWTGSGAPTALPMR